ncbi:MAG: hypothetical protein LBT91_03415 [Bifidobacteriaceae bacterium]|jgi:hypothetical protein|nr:hypothetical protein [Bifidobacteriaceae bacterium]
MNELFKSKKIWLQNVITPKKRAFRKLGVLGIIFLFGTAAFISGFSINSYAASSSTVLPIARGGTNANTAAQASSNILGSNFANYEGVLPSSKGGAGFSEINASGNNTLTSLPKFTYAINTAHQWKVNSAYIKVGTSLLTGNYVNTLSVQSIYIIGFTEAQGGTGIPLEYMLTIKPWPNAGVTPETASTSNVTVSIKSYSINCSSDNYIGYYTVGPSETNPTKAVADVWLWKGGSWTTPPSLNWFYYNNYANTVAQFTPEDRETNNRADIPEGAVKIYPYCFTYTAPSPPTPTPTPTDSPTP